MKRINKISLFLVLSAFLFFFIKVGIIDPCNLKHNSRYTIGEVTGIKKRSHGSPVVEYFFYVKGKKYNNFNAFGGNPNNIQTGIKYFIKFYTKNPVNSEILIDRPVPDRMKVPPFEGWPELPNIL